MFGRERGQKGVEIDRRRPAVDLRLRAETERATDFRCLGTELVGLPILIDLLTRSRVLPSAEAVLDTVVGRRRFGQVRRDPSQAVPSAALDVIQLGDRLEVFEGDAGAVVRERLHVGTYSSRPAAPTPIEPAPLPSSTVAELSP